MDRRFEQRANEESFLEGIPQEVWEKPGDYEETLPLIKRTVGLVKQFGNTKPNKRGALLDQYAQPVARNPQAWKSLINNLDLISELKPELNVTEIRNQLFTQIEALATRRANLAQWKPEKIEELMKLGLDASGELAGTVERVKASIFNAPRTPTEAVDLHHKAAWAMISTDDNQIREELFSILCFEKPWFPAKSLGNFYFTLGANFPDDATWEKYQAVIGALKPVGLLLETKGEFVPNVPKRVQHRDLRLLESQSLISETEQIARERIVLQYVNQNPQRFARIKAYVLNKEDEIYADLLQPKAAFEVLEGVDFLKKSQELKEEKNNPENQTWPKNIIYSRNEPLNVLVREAFFPKVYRTLWESYQRVARERGFEKITNAPIQLTDDVELDLIAKGPLTLEQKQEIVREVRTALVIGDTEVPSPRAVQSLTGVIDIARNLTSVVANYDKAGNIIFNVSKRLPEEEIGRLSSILEYHRPFFTLEQIKAIETQIGHLREDLQKGFTRAVGRRGYTLMVSDPFLRRLGYKEITVNQASTSNRLHVRMAIDGEEYNFDLNGDYRIIFGQDLKQIKNAQDKAWLEVLVLSHLKKLICTSNEEDELKTELVGGARQYERYRKQVGRAEHLRRQKPGWNYSADAFNKCLKSNLPVKNLHLINRMKAEIGQGGTKETGIWTYVKGAEYVDNPDAKPIKLAFTKASDDIRKVVPLGRVSQEELTRLEEDLLQEMGY
ncbi:hypothetical protein A3J19_01185 [Candidatus Daviesbacteria bacterium RIFCSPLOWO2_02_FULL_41_8]|uniref:Uncharacterized protein n=2 Tax=Candidatus Daviesiibacteriota TaxID=1752718 RepID=A0A1F5NKK3_9BACT|nr:MAG: hypothetical protein A2871_02955 [Candidatus Daviesbacteria bacterium RIFCSPHIGHO2_01_FULL_41_23]OGE78073.1 MAG: hypothetical protein A3J19_01185 [Candidatus Daviesbacteria bacterium RIFCSPLOWO2_02_FULL_41_8]